MDYIDYRAVGDIIRNDLSERQRERLKDHIMVAARDFQITDIAILLPMILSNQPVQLAVIKTVTSFITNEMRASIQ